MAAKLYNNKIEKMLQEPKKIVFITEPMSRLTGNGLRLDEVKDLKNQPVHAIFPFKFILNSYILKHL